MDENCETCEGTGVVERLGGLGGYDPYTGETVMSELEVCDCHEEPAEESADE